MNFHGVRLHVLARKQTNRSPLPAQVWMRQGKCSQLNLLIRKDERTFGTILLFDNKVYADEKFKAKSKKQDIQLLTPFKKPKKKELSGRQKHTNKIIPTFRQPIESFFKWLIDKTDIQRASQIRSTEGLLILCLGKLSFALLLLNFYY